MGNDRVQTRKNRIPEKTKISSGSRIVIVTARFLTTGINQTRPEKYYCRKILSRIMISKFSVIPWNPEFWDVRNVITHKICVYACMHVCLCIHTYMKTKPQMLLSVHMYVCMYLCMYVCFYMCMYACFHSILTCTHCVYVHACLVLFMYVFTHSSRTYLYVYTHALQVTYLNSEYE
jgi:hypothetical protein